MDNDGTGARRPSPLLRSKLRRPAVPDYVVPRPRLDAALDAASARAITLVIAPAGAGKTQLLSSWAAGVGRPLAWLSLEEMDDDPNALWSGAAAALDGLAPGRADAARAVMAGGSPALDVVAALLDGLEEASVDDAVLVIDDVHHIVDPVTAASLSLFLRHLPPWLHVVAAARTDPVLPLDRLRGRGELRELRFTELRFTPDEARDVFTRIALDASEEEVAASVEQNDGWVAGLQLAALSSRAAGARPSTPAAGGVLVDDYVWHEVLATGDPEVVDVLQQLSVVDRVDVALAAAITGRPDVRDVLVRAEAQGLFVFRLGGPGDWFRIHPLVRESLRRELARSGRHEAGHEQAARWFEAAGATVDALGHWLLAGRHREALRLLAARSTELYDEGREAVIGRTLDAIPHDVAVADVPALVDLAVSQILGPRDTFVATVRDLTWRCREEGAARPPSVDALEAIATALVGDWTATERSARQAISGLGAAWWGDPAGRFAWNVGARAVALAERWDDDEPFVRDATTAMGRDPRRGLSLEGIRALGHAMAGRPVDALRLVEAVRPAAASMSILRVEVALAESLARRELGDDERARAGLQALAEQPDEPRLFAPVAAMLALAGDAADDGSVEAALEHLDRADALVAAARAGRHLREWVDVRGVTVALAAGDVTAARRRAHAVGDPFWGPVSQARLALAAGERADATVALAAAAPRSPRHDVVLALLLARAATAPDAVLDHVTRAVERASEHGMLRTVVAEGRPLADVVERAAWRVPEAWLHRVRLAMASVVLAAPSPTRDLPETLTSREREVLRLLPSRLTLGEIATELFLSVNTVKFHLRVIYRKLGVNSREEAAAIARRLRVPAAR